MNRHDRRAARVRAPRTGKPTHAELSRAIRSTLPGLIALGYESLSECYFASALGAQIFRLYGYDAKAILTTAGICRVADGICNQFVTVGAGNFDDAAVVATALGIELPDTAAWALVGENPGGHAIIQSGNQLIDLTMGQVNALAPGLSPYFCIFADDVPLGQGWAFDRPDGARNVVWLPPCASQLQSDAPASLAQAERDVREGLAPVMQRAAGAAVARFLATGDFHLGLAPGEALALCQKLGFAA